MVWGEGSPKWEARWRPAEDKGSGPPARCHPGSTALSVLSQGIHHESMGPERTPEMMRSESLELQRVIEECGGKHLDEFMAGAVKEVLVSEAIRASTWRRR